MRVCLVTTAFPRWINDSRGPSMMETARALRDLGILVRVITLHSPGAASYEWVEEIEVIRVRYMWPEAREILLSDGGGLPAVWRKSQMARFVFLPFFIALVMAVARYARDCDVIHAHWTLSAFAAWLSSAIHRRPYIVTVHGSDIFQAAKIPIARWFTKKSLEKSGHLLAVSQALAEATASIISKSKPIEVLPDGIDVERFTLGSDKREPLILFVGSLIERKGIAFLLEAMAIVLVKFPFARLILVGDGPQRELFQEQATKLKILPSVVFIGSQSQQQVSQWMKKAKVFVLPSLEEALGIVLLEALASGTPCVASQIGGIPEIVVPSVGRIVPPANSVELAGAIQELLEFPETWLKLHLAARQHVLENCLTWYKVALRLHDIYQNNIPRQENLR